MELKELYEKIGGDYDDVMMRFGKETRIKRFLGLFLKDTSFSELQTGIEARDWETAFRAAHTLKGVAGNMSFEKLRASASELTEAIRGGVELKDFALYDTVCADFALTLNGVQDYLNENP